MATLCTRAWVHGLVQGVGFRYRTRREAEALGLTGFARNLDDGSVEILACGEESSVAALVRWLQAGGPKGARVDKVLLQPSQPREIPEDFTTGWQ